MIALGLAMGINLRKSVVATGIIIVILIVIESIVAFFVGFDGGSAFSRVEYQSIFVVVSVDVITLLVSNSLKRFKNINKNIDIPTSYWISIFIFPIMSLILLIAIFEFSQESRSMIVLSSLVILTMNLIIFSLYDRLIVQYEKKLDDIAIKHINIGYKKQLEMMKASILNVKSFERDIKRHIVSLEVLAEGQQYDDLKEYIEKMKIDARIRDILSTMYTYHWTQISKNKL